MWIRDNVSETGGTLETVFVDDGYSTATVLGMTIEGFDLVACWRQFFTLGLFAITEPGFRDEDKV